MLAILSSTQVADFNQPHVCAQIISGLCADIAGLRVICTRCFCSLDGLFESSSLDLKQLLSLHRGVTSIDKGLCYGDCNSAAKVLST